jgi:hypothetical protein
VTLVVGLAVFGMWMRSRFMCDQFSFPYGEHQCHIFADDGTLSVYFVKLAPGEGRYTGWYSGDNYNGAAAIQLAMLSMDGRSATREIPFLYLAMPLSLLSIYLLLWKPRKAKPSDSPANPNS